jgi:hypothetical protein
VADYMRHGARSHNEDNRDPSFFDGAQKGHLTHKGRVEQRRVGQQRRREYIKEKRFLKEEYDPSEILSIATFRERCIESGRHYLEGMYPLTDLCFKEDIVHHDDVNTPLDETIYERVL